MAELTLTSKNACSVGNVTRVTATCASVATGSTWSTGMSAVKQLFMAPDLGLVWSWTESAGVITFTIANGPLLNVSLEAIGGT
jgi:hypothetical protein